MARPKSKIDPEVVKKLASINCSYAEIAAVIGCDASTLTRRGFTQVIQKGRDIGKSSLKRKMWDIAINGNVTMCIWLSKIMLGYKEENQFDPGKLLESLDSYIKKLESNGSTPRAISTSGKDSKPTKE